MRFGDLTVQTRPGPTGSPELRLTLPAPDDRIALEDATEATSSLDRREVEALHEYLGEWLR